MSEKRPERSGGNPNAPILMMMGAVPLIVGVAVVLVVVLARSGFGLLFSLGLPFGFSMVVIVALGVWLARRASRRNGNAGTDGTGDIRRKNRE